MKRGSECLVVCLFGCLKNIYSGFGYKKKKTSILFQGESQTAPD